MKYFANITTAEELKKEFRALSIKLHPDRGGNAEEFAEMLNEYEQKAAELSGEPMKSSRARRSSLWAVRGRRMIYEYTYTTYYYVLVDPDKGEFLRVFSEDFASVEDVEDYDPTETRIQHRPENIRPYSAKFGIGYYWDDNAPLYTEAEIAEFEKRARNFEHWRNIYEEQEAEKERQEKAARLAEYVARCKKWARLLQVVPAVTETAYNDTRKAQERKAHSVRRANVLAMARTAFPGVKFSLSFSHSWGGGFTLSWVDGPTDDEVEERCDFDLFVSTWDTFDGMDDCAGIGRAEFTEFATKYGGFRGTVQMKRETSDKVEKMIAAALVKLCPEFAEDWEKLQANRFARTASRSLSREQVEQVAKEAGANNWQHVTEESGWSTWHDHDMAVLIHVIACRCSFAVVQEEKQPTFAAKHNATYKAVKKALGSHAVGKKSEVLDVYALIDFVPGCGLRVGQPHEYKGKKSLSRFCSSSYTNEAKRIARYKAAGIDIKAYGEIIAVSPEIVEGLKADRADVEQQRKAWEAAQNAPKAEKDTKTTATASAKAESVATDGETLAEGDGVQLIATEKGAEFTGNTYAHKDEIKALGARWYRLGQCWTIKADKIAEAVAMVNGWNKDEDETANAYENETANAYENETANAYENENENTADTLHDAEEITDTAEAVDAEPVADHESETAEAVARVALAFVDLCQMLADVAKAQQEEADRARKAEAEANETKARKAAHAQEVQTLREGIATLSAQLATMSEQLRTMSDRLAELTQTNDNDNDNDNRKAA